jgi:hypothetical protein
MTFVEGPLQWRYFHRVAGTRIEPEPTIQQADALLFELRLISEILRRFHRYWGTFRNQDAKCERGEWELGSSFR